MSGKTLSNGTLSLRFMQNAQRAKLQAQVEAEQAKIKDDAEWSVSQEMKDAWGIGQSSQSTEDTVHESSYLPFIYQTNTVGSSDEQTQERPKFRGRRTFNAKGVEVVAEESKPAEDGEDAPSASSDRDEKPRVKLEKRPTAISGFRAPLSTRPDGKKPRTKTAQMLIREDSAAQPPRPVPPETAAIPRSAGFVKPEGVDAPSFIPPPPPKKAAVESGHKREIGQEDGEDPAAPEKKRRKKKKEPKP